MNLLQIRSFLAFSRLHSLKRERKRVEKRGGDEIVKALSGHCVQDYVFDKH